MNDDYASMDAMELSRVYATFWHQKLGPHREGPIESFIDAIKTLNGFGITIGRTGNDASVSAQMISWLTVCKDQEVQRYVVGDELLGTVVGIEDSGVVNIQLVAIPQHGTVNRRRRKDDS